MNTPGTPGRPRRRAIVAPSELARTLHTTLDAAKLKLLDVQKAEQPCGGGSESHRYLVMQFVRSARGVYPVAKTFGRDWLPGNRFKVWRDKWEDGLTDAEQTLWHHVQELRDIDEHGEGAPLTPVAIPVALDDCVPTNAALPGLGPAHQPAASKIGAGFSPYPGKAASEVCSEYLQLCRRFVEDFLRDHPP
jgi:hypothetical protein